MQFLPVSITLSVMTEVLAGQPLDVSRLCDPVMMSAGRLLIRAPPQAHTVVV